MLDTPLSSEDLAALRASGHTSHAYLSLWQGRVVAESRIASSSFPNPLASITLTSAPDGVRAGMSVRIGKTPGGAEVGLYRVRGISGSVLHLAETSTGDAGKLAVAVMQAIAQDDYVTVVDTWDVWSVLPRITYTNNVGTIYKDFDLMYDGHNGAKVRGVLRLGAHQAGFMDEVSFTATAQSFDGATVNAYLWYVDGVYQSAAATNTFILNAAPGQYVVRCAVGMSNGASMEAVRVVHLHDRVAYPPYEITIESASVNRKGRRMSVTLLADPDDLPDDVYEGAMVQVWEDARWGGHVIPSAVTAFPLFIASVETGVALGGLTTITLELVSALDMLDEYVVFAQIVEYAAAPGHWQQSVYMTPDYFIFYLLYYHTSLLTLFDLHLSGLTYLAKSWAISRGTVVAEIDSALRRVNAELTQASDGSLYIRRDPHLLSAAGRAALTRRVTLTDDDGSEMTGTQRIRPRVGKVNGNALMSGTGALMALQSDAPAVVSGQGGGTAQLNDQLVFNQTELNERTGHEYARLNNPETLSFKAAGNLDVIEPALRYLVVWEECEHVVNEVSITYAPGGIKEVSFSMERLVSGVPGVTIPIVPARYTYDTKTGLPVPKVSTDFGFGTGWPSLPGYPGSALPQPVVITTPNVTPESSLVEAVLVWSISGLARTRQPSSTNPEWEIIFPEPLQDAVQEGTGTGVYLVSSQKLYYCPDALAATPNFEIVAEFEGGVTLRYVQGENLVVVHGIVGSANFIRVFDNGVEINSHTIPFSAAGKDPFHFRGMDTDDYGLGVIVFAVGGDIFYVSSYTGTPAMLISLGSYFSPMAIRIPARRVSDAGASLNNNKGSLEFVYGANGKFGLVTVNFNTGTVISEVELFPVENGNPVQIVGDGLQGNTFEIYGGSGAVIVGVFANISEPNAERYYLLAKAGAGQWVVHQVSMLFPTYGAVRFLRPDQGGDGYKMWLVGESGRSDATSLAIFYTSNRGITLQNRTGNLYDLTGLQKLRGVLVLP